MADTLPPKIRYAYWYEGLNAVSYQICLGSPLILFANQLGASAVVLGILAGLSPLTSVIQLAVAPYAEKIGYRRLMVNGWTARVSILIFMVILPLVSHAIGELLAIWIMLAVMFIFTLSRGIAVCSWLPWIAAIVPKSLRGYFLSWDRLFVNGGTLIALGISGTILLQHTMLGYSAVFLISFLGGMISLYFLRRIPEPQATASISNQPQEKLSWKTLMADGAFVRMVIFSCAVQVVIAASNTFTVVFVRDHVGLGDGPILWLTAGAAVLSMFATQVLRMKADEVGSKPLLVFAFGWWVIYFVLWFLLSVNGMPQPILSVCLLILANGFFAAIYDLALTRLLMNIAGDRPASAQYFAFQSVVNSVITGLSPIAWGFVLDGLEGIRTPLAGFNLSNYSYLFGAQGVLLLLLVGVTLWWLREPNAQPFRRVVYDTFVVKPIQTISGIKPGTTRKSRRH
jgi:MFS family permease